MKKILLRNSWQVNNIGDIAHPLGFLKLAKQFLPEYEIWLWPCIISPAVREMILRNFPGLHLVENEEALQEAFVECDLLINGSSAGMEAAGILDWKEKTGKPYGLFGVSADGLWTEKRKMILPNGSRCGGTGGAGGRGLPPVLSNLSHIMRHLTSSLFTITSYLFFTSSVICCANATFPS